MDVDIADVTAFLATHYDDASPPLPLARGEWSHAFAFTLSDDRDLVIRFGDYREDYEKDRIAAGFDSPDLPVPEVVEVGEAFGGVYSISTRALGRFLEGLDGVGFRDALPAVFAVLDALRDVQPLGAGYGWWGPDGAGSHASWRDFLLDVRTEYPRTAGWPQRLASRPGAQAAFDRAYDALDQLTGACPDDVRHVVHQDLMAGNVLVDDTRIAAVFDWGNSLYGDFLYDLAHIAFWLPWFPDLEGIDVAAEASAHFEAIDLDVPNFEERLRCCMVHIGLDAQTYNAFTERWDELERSAQRTLQVAGA